METGIFFENLRAAYPGADDARLLEKAAENGFSYIELDYDGLKEKPRAFFEKAESLSVGFSLYCFTDENCVLRDGTPAEDALAFLKEYGIKNLMTVVRPALCRENRHSLNEKIFASLNRLCDRAEEYGVNILAEDFDASDIPCGNCEDMLLFSENVPKLRFTLDTGNFAFFGEDLFSCYEKLKHNIGHVHLKDRVSVSDLRVTATGKGGLQIEKILKMLKDDGYNGRLSVEMFGAEPCPAEIAYAAAFVKGAAE